jgi:hypothetical protein
MSDSSATQLKSETEIKRRQESSFLEALVPIPDFFFNIKAEIEPIGGSAWVIRMLAYLLYFLTLCVMFGSFTYYSLPAQRLSLESFVTSEWQKTGFACKPLQKTTLHGMSTDWSFDECVSAVTSPGVENVVSVQKTDGSTYFDFKFASGGVVSFYDLRFETSVLQKSNAATDWQRDGFSCHPEPPYDNYFDVVWNYSECLGIINSPSAANVLPDQYDSYRYYPFGSDSSCYPGRGTWMGDVRQRLTAQGAQTLSAANSHNCMFTYDSIAHDYAVSQWSAVVSTPADQVGDFFGDYICGILKRNGNGFRCFDKSNPPATKELAIQRYASEYPPATICAPLKLNSPFQCTRNVEVPATTRLSLSVAAAQAVFALAGIALVVLLRKLQKPSTKTSESLSTDGDLRSLVRKLRLIVDQLRTGQDQLRIGQGTHEELIQKLLSKEGGR